MAVIAPGQVATESLTLLNLGAVATDFAFDEHSQAARLSDESAAGDRRGTRMLADSSLSSAAMPEPGSATRPWAALTVDVPWLSVEPSSGTVAADGIAAIDVIMDASSSGAT